ncbi:hypothetical protein [Streptomyces sp. V4I8]|uniref:hypothetical protein n=1 Tax=Streptomyces sp. V4I8 TaxID=3156469 RepID=UPI0035193F8D
MRTYLKSNNPLMDGFMAAYATHLEWAQKKKALDQYPTPEHTLEVRDELWKDYIRARGQRLLDMHREDYGGARDKIQTWAEGEKARVRQSFEERISAARGAERDALVRERDARVQAIDDRAKGALGDVGANLDSIYSDEAVKQPTEAERAEWNSEYKKGQQKFADDFKAGLLSPSSFKDAGQAWKSTFTDGDAREYGRRNLSFIQRFKYNLAMGRYIPNPIGDLGTAYNNERVKERVDLANRKNQEALDGNPLKEFNPDPERVRKGFEASRYERQYKGDDGGHLSDNTQLYGNDAVKLSLTDDNDDADQSLRFHENYRKLDRDFVEHPPEQLDLTGRKYLKPDMHDIRQFIAPEGSGAPDLWVAEGAGGRTVVARDSGYSLTPKEAAAARVAFKGQLPERVDRELARQAGQPVPVIPKGQPDPVGDAYQQLTQDLAAGREPVLKTPLTREQWRDLQAKVNEARATADGTGQMPPGMSDPLLHKMGSYARRQANGEGNQQNTADEAVDEFGNPLPPGQRPSRQAENQGHAQAVHGAVTPSAGGNGASQQEFGQGRPAGENLHESAMAGGSSSSPAKETPGGATKSGESKDLRSDVLPDDGPSEGSKAPESGAGGGLDGGSDEPRLRVAKSPGFGPSEEGAKPEDLKLGQSQGLKPAGQLSSSGEPQVGADSDKTQQDEVGKPAEGDTGLGGWLDASVKAAGSGSTPVTGVPGDAAKPVSAPAEGQVSGPQQSLGLNPGLNPELAQSATKPPVPALNAQQPVQSKVSDPRQSSEAAVSQPSVQTLFRQQSSDPAPAADASVKSGKPPADTPVGTFPDSAPAPAAAAFGAGVGKAAGWLGSTNYAGLFAGGGGAGESASSGSAAAGDLTKAAAGDAAGAVSSGMASVSGQNTGDPAKATAWDQLKTTGSNTAWGQTKAVVGDAAGAVSSGIVSVSGQNTGDPAMVWGQVKSAGSDGAGSAGAGSVTSVPDAAKTENSMLQTESNQTNWNNVFAGGGGTGQTSGTELGLQQSVVQPQQPASASASDVQSVVQPLHSAPVSGAEQKSDVSGVASPPDKTLQQPVQQEQFVDQGLQQSQQQPAAETPAAVAPAENQAAPSVTTPGPAPAGEATAYAPTPTGDYSG